MSVKLFSEDPLIKNRSVTPINETPETVSSGSIPVTAAARELATKATRLLSASASSPSASFTQESARNLKQAPPPSTKESRELSNGHRAQVNRDGSVTVSIPLTDAAKASDLMIKTKDYNFSGKVVVTSHAGSLESFKEHSSEQLHIQKKGLPNGRGAVLEVTVAESLEGVKLGVDGDTISINPDKIKKELFSLKKADKGHAKIAAEKAGQSPQTLRMISTQADQPDPTSSTPARVTPPPPVPFQIPPAPDRSTKLQKILTEADQALAHTSGRGSPNGAAPNTEAIHQNIAAFKENALKIEETLYKNRLELNTQFTTASGPEKSQIAQKIQEIDKALTLNLPRHLSDLKDRSTSLDPAALKTEMEKPFTELLASVSAPSVATAPTSGTNSQSTQQSQTSAQIIQKLDERRRSLASSAGDNFASPIFQLSGDLQVLVNEARAVDQALVKNLAAQAAEYNKPGANRSAIQQKIEMIHEARSRFTGELQVIADQDPTTYAQTRIMSRFESDIMQTSVSKAVSTAQQALPSSAPSSLNPEMERVVKELNDQFSEKFVRAESPEQALKDQIAFLKSSEFKLIDDKNVVFSKDFPDKNFTVIVTRKDNPNWLQATAQALTTKSPSAPSIPSAPSTPSAAPSAAPSAPSSSTAPSTPAASTIDNSKNLKLVVAEGTPSVSGFKALSGTFDLTANEKSGGLSNPVGFRWTHGSTEGYSFLRAIKDKDTEGPNKPATLHVVDSKTSSPLEKVVLAVYAQHLDENSRIKFNEEKSLSRALTVNSTEYTFAQVRSDGSVVLSSTARNTSPIVISAKQDKAVASVVWRTTTVEKTDSGGYVRVRDPLTRDADELREALRVKTIEYKRQRPSHRGDAREEIIQKDIYVDVERAKKLLQKYTKEGKVYELLNAFKNDEDVIALLKGTSDDKQREEILKTLIGDERVTAVKDFNKSRPWVGTWGFNWTRDEVTINNINRNLESQKSVIDTPDKEKNLRLMNIGWSVLFRREGDPDFGSILTQEREAANK